MTTVELDVESIAAGGDGVARRDGLVVFVPRTAPGDRVRARVVQRGRLGRGFVEHIDRPGAHRTAPPCIHYERDRCGGCQLQHLDAGAQRAAKSQIIVDSFRRIGGRVIAPPAVHAGAKEWRYRRKLTMALRHTASGWIAGLHAFDNVARIVAIDDCLIADERLLVAWREILGASGALPPSPELRGSVTLLDDGAVGFVLEGGGSWPRLRDFTRLVSGISAFWWRPDGGALRQVHDRRRPNAAPAASFVQVNPEVASLLHQFVLAEAVRRSPSTVIDAYAGSGDMSEALAARGVEVVSVELDEAASRYAAERLTAPSRAVNARVEDVLPSLLPTDVVILNPPRAGVVPSVAAALESATSHAIIYVSCDPATLARDVKRLPSWEIESTTAFDMFPQTAHVETVCVLTRPAA